MEKKPILKTKSFWTGLGSILTGAGLIYTGHQGDGLNMIFTGLGIIFLRKAIK